MLSAVSPRSVSLSSSRPRWVIAAFSPLTWREFAFHAAHLPIAIGGLLWFIAAVALGLPLGVTWVGLVVSAFLLAGSAGFASATRKLSHRLLGQSVILPRKYDAKPGAVGYVTTRFRHAATWRALAFLPVSFVLTVATFCISTGVLITAWGAMTHSVWGQYLPEQIGNDGKLHRGAQFLGVFVDTAPLQVGFAVLGVTLFLFVWPGVNHGLSSLQRVVIRSMLGASRAEARLTEVTRSRAAVVQDADDTLRRIERELHDGTQARLVGLAMTLGDARDRLQNGAEAGVVAPLVDQAHSSTGEALVELRELARGMHPPVLDDGLESALISACSRVPFPVSLEVSLRARPSTVIESIAYFSVLELLTNVSKHARATHARVTIAELSGRIELEVRDNGCGGAYVSPGDGAGHRTGLAGLLERARSVDGTIDVDSPAGGPTLIRMSLPVPVAPAA
ncbi:sensor histidine kinase [Cryobacterium zongtaii]|uniref:histidine kinase n=1 Tax=Cryobacterium zongtaii TaxID=1259217 RepID=A0A2S3Z5U4_9MICO|nr:sensor histidine kinase [Cryobacterium zongtaii]POH59590.1 sensor histidine kinase [Cryobacterium zongtaii]